MNILMFTNTYLPHVGGVANSVQAFASAYRERGHRVLIVAPEFPRSPRSEQDVVRVPALQKFNGSDFSVRLPVPGYLETVLKDFQPDIVHSHHPFLLGDTALRVASQYNVPLVFQHHTMYERYTHYVPGDSPAMQRFAIDLSTQYANLCDQVLAPSESVAAELRRRGVAVPVDVLPTGVDVERFASGNGGRVREELGIPADAFVVGHVGRLAPEKNLEFLARGAARALEKEPAFHLLVVGDGPSAERMRRIFADRSLESRLHLAGSRGGTDLVDAYHSMNVFAFASKTETQGMVLTEAMAAGCPVVGLDAPGVREVVDDGGNGRLLDEQGEEQFAAALHWVFQRSADEYEALCRQARATSDRYSMAACSQHGLELYRSVLDAFQQTKLAGEEWDTTWQAVLRRVETEWNLLTARLYAAGRAIAAGPS